MSLVLETTTPGVTAILNAGQVSRPLERQPTSTAFMSGFSVWGPVKQARLVTSFADFVRQFGGLHANSHLANAAKIFFDLYGGTQAYISRVVGTTPVVATKTLMDRAGTPVATVRVDGKYPSSVVDIKVEVQAGTDVNTCKLIFTSVYLGLTETYDNFKVDALNITYVNDRSKLVKLTNLNSATAAPNNLPALSAAAALTGGTDDFSTLNTAGYEAGLTAFNDEQLGTGQVLIPGVSGAHAALNAHAEKYKRLAILDPALGSDYEAVAAAADVARSKHIPAMPYPWVKMRDFAGSDTLKFYPPSAFVAGECAKVDRTIGTHKAPANNGVVPMALDVERNPDGSVMMTENMRGVLNGKGIIAIAPIPGEGIKVYGARGLYPQGETRIRFIHEQRMLNLIYHTAKKGYGWAVFAVVDGQGRLFRDLKAAGQNFLRNLWRSGGLFGKTEAEAFVVVCDESNNPKDELEQGRVHIQIGVKLSPTAEMIIINVDSVPLSQDLNVLNGGGN